MKILLFIKKRKIYQHVKIKKINLKNYLRVEITKQEKQKQPKLLKRKTKAYVKISGEKYYRNMMLFNYSLTQKAKDKIETKEQGKSKDYPLFMEIRITKITLGQIDTEKFRQTAISTKERILNIFYSYRGAIKRNTLGETQTTIQEILKSPHRITKGQENEEISAGEIQDNEKFNYFNKYLRIKNPAIHNASKKSFVMFSGHRINTFGEVEYHNNTIEDYAKQHGLVIDKYGRLWPKFFIEQWKEQNNKR
jgi:hypothetical protein